MWLTWKHETKLFPIAEQRPYVDVAFFVLRVDMTIQEVDNWLAAQNHKATQKGLPIYALARPDHLVAVDKTLLEAEESAPVIAAGSVGKKTTEERDRYVLRLALYQNRRELSMTQSWRSFRRGTRFLLVRVG